jgi:hypothetical protein
MRARRGDEEEKKGAGMKELVDKVEWDKSLQPDSGQWVIRKSHVATSHTATVPPTAADVILIPPYFSLFPLPPCLLAVRNLLRCTHPHP